VSATLHHEPWLGHFSCEGDYSFADDSIPFTDEGLAPGFVNAAGMDHAFNGF
jgi:hypothetical protein